MRSSTVSGTGKTCRDAVQDSNNFFCASLRHLRSTAVGAGVTHGALTLAAHKQRPSEAPALVKPLLPRGLPERLQKICILVFRGIDLRKQARPLCWHVAIALAPPFTLLIVHRSRLGVEPPPM